MRQLIAVAFCACALACSGPANEQSQAVAITDADSVVEEEPLERTTPISLVESFGMTFGAAEANSTRAMAPLGLQLVRHFEGWEEAAGPDQTAIPYDDPSQYCTIGYGHLIDLKPCATINPLPFAAGLSPADGAALLEQDTAYARRAVQTLVTVDLNDEQFAALSAFAFNVGRENFRRSTLLRLLNEGEYDAASRQLRRWVKSGGRTLNGLIRRRACEELLFRSELELAADGNFDPAPCVTLGSASSPPDPIDISVGE